MLCSERRAGSAGDAGSADADRHGMVAGVFLRFGLDLVRAFARRSGSPPPMVVGLPGPVGVARLRRGGCRRSSARCWSAPRAVVVLGRHSMPPRWGASAIVHPDVTCRQLSWAAMVELVVPLAITVLVVQNGAGHSRFCSATGHNPPINAIDGRVRRRRASSPASSARRRPCLTGPMNALITSSGDERAPLHRRDLHRLLAMAFGLLAPSSPRLLLATPQAFIVMLAGLAMLRVLQTAFIVSFGGPLHARRTGVLPGDGRRRADPAASARRSGAWWPGSRCHGCSNGATSRRPPRGADAPARRRPRARRRMLRPRRGD